MYLNIRQTTRETSVFLEFSKDFKGFYAFCSYLACHHFQLNYSEFIF